MSFNRCTWLSSTRLEPNLVAFTGFYFTIGTALVCLTGFYWVSCVLLEFDRVLLGFTGFYRVLLGFNGFDWLLLGFYWVLLAFHWVLLAFHWV